MQIGGGPMIFMQGKRGGHRFMHAYYTLAKRSRKSTQVRKCELANTNLRCVAKQTRTKTQVQRK